MTLSSKRRMAWLAVLSAGTLFQGTCDAVLETIGFAFSIVDVWV